MSGFASSPLTRGARLALAVTAAAATLGGAALAGPASAAPAALAAPAGIYGSQDPTYDGVYRQSLSLLALRGSGIRPAPAAVNWLLAQQCADGGFTGFRANPATACVPAQEDSNATGAAAQALVSVGQDAAAAKAAGWLVRRISPTDGGVGYNPGLASDANSTGIALSAFAATGVDVAASPGPVQALAGLTLGCSADDADRGAVDYQKQETPAANDLATGQAVLGLAGKALPLSASTVADDAPVLTCPAIGDLTREQLAAAGAGYLARRLATSEGSLPSAFGSGKDYGTTADAALALVASGHGAAALTTTTATLAGVASSWPKDPAGKDRPAALAKLALVATATGGDARSFGGTDLLARLQATLMTSAAPAPAPSTKPSAPATPAAPATPSTPQTGTTPATTPRGTDTLPDTGTTSGELALLGAGSVLIGGALLRLGTRRRSV